MQDTSNLEEMKHNERALVAPPSKLESLSPNSRWILFKNTGSGEVEREARQPRARQRHLGCEEPPATRIMMRGLGLHP